METIPSHRISRSSLRRSTPTVTARGDLAADEKSTIELFEKSRGSVVFIKDASRKVFLILDHLRVHHSRIVKAWVAKRNDLIELFYLPSYSCELNPEERLNTDLKQEIGKHVQYEPKPS